MKNIIKKLTVLSLSCVLFIHILPAKIGAENSLAAGLAQTERSSYDGGEFMACDVKLTEGIFKQSQETGLKYLLSFDVERLLAPLYNNTEYTSPKESYGGWESTQIAGQTIGHYLTACSYMYAQTNDERLKEIAEHTVSVMEMLQCEDGFLGGFDRSYLDRAFNGDITAGGQGGAYLNGCWAPWYNLHKTFQGLMDVYTVFGNEEALTIAKKLADYAANGCDRLTDAQLQAMLEGEHGGMMEAFVNLHNITGNERYLSMAKRWTHYSITNPLAEGRDELTGIHGNTQIPKIIGCIKYYIATGDTYYYNAAKNFWNFVVNDRSYIFGGNTRSEHFDEKETEILSINTAETCNTYNMLKLAVELFKVEKKSEYADYYETALFNHILASQDPDSGAKIYFLSTLPGQFKIYCTHDNAFWCCMCTGMENPGRYSDFIYRYDNSELYLNLFINSQINWTEKNIKLTQTTDFPSSGNVGIKIDEAENCEAVLRIRVPSWTENMTVKVNGELVTLYEENGYMKIERTWNTDDEIELSMPMNVSMYKSRESDQSKDVVGFKYGPIVLAGTYGTENMPQSDLDKNHSINSSYPMIKINPIVEEDDDISHCISKVPDEMQFLMNVNQPGSGKVTEVLLPLYNVHHVRYTMYWTKYTEDQYAYAGVGETFEEKIFNATVDSVEPALQQSETDHCFTYEGKTSTGYFDAAGCSWRDLTGEGYISYNLKVKPNVTNYLLTVLWGSDTGSGTRKRTFDIVVDGTVIDTYTIDKPAPDELYYLYYKIPDAVIEGKETVNVMYRSNSENAQAGGIFGIRITTEKVTPNDGIWESCYQLSKSYSLGKNNNNEVQVMEFDLMTRYENIDGIIEYTNHETSIAPAAWRICGIVVRMNKSGTFDGVDGGYFKDTEVPYKKNTLYHFKIVANLSGKKYDLYINEYGEESKLALGQCSFRTSAVEINNIGRIAVSGGSGVDAGQFYVKNHIIYTPGICNIDDVTTIIDSDTLNVKAYISAFQSDETNIIFALYDNNMLKSTIIPEKEIMGNSIVCEASLSGVASCEEPVMKIFVWKENLSPQSEVYEKTNFQTK